MLKGLKASRRSFFGLMGTAPLAAKAAADKMVGDLVGVNEFKAFGPPRNVGPLMGSEPKSVDHVPYEELCSKARAYITTFGVPDFMDAQMRRQARDVYSLDPDIAAKRTWSMSVKIQTQRERNYQKILADYMKDGWTGKARTALNKLTGFDWPWW